MSDTIGEVKVPGYIAGRWNVDSVHSEVGFSVRHMMVSKVRGKFTKYETTTCDRRTSSRWRSTPP
jgi:polyisoprenoid-binding protein YceI